MICILISVGAVLISVAYLAWEFRVAPVIPDPSTVQAIQDAPDPIDEHAAQACALTEPAPAPDDDFAAWERELETTP